MKSFDFHSPATVPAAIALLGGAVETRLVAGGMTLLPTLKQRLASPAALVDLSKIPQLSGIAFDGPWLALSQNSLEPGVDLILGMRQLRRLHLYFAFGERKLYATAIAAMPEIAPVLAGQIGRAHV